MKFIASAAEAVVVFSMLLVWTQFMVTAYTTSLKLQVGRATATAQNLKQKLGSTRSASTNAIFSTHFSIDNNNKSTTTTITSTTAYTLSRRRLADKVVAVLFGSASVATVQDGVISPRPAHAASNDDDKSKIVKGLERLNYLLDNWEKETTICGRSDNPYTGTKGCERTPLRVMEYMGYKSMNDPLFKADKTLKRLASAVSSNDQQSDFLEAIEKWAEASEEASNMAYMSSWGEANPGGGKDRVEYFIERAKKNVTDARDSLSRAVQILRL